ncbi:hypothetical protein [Variovorax sp. YR752]|uniref:hypothetical protein n=1 Tax=Variovorax sp. YR752 TaxID=1884383 RepID=UPI003137C5EF
MTIELRGISDAVRAAAACRGMGVAQLVRRAVVMNRDLRTSAAVAPMKRGSDGQTPGHAPAQETAKLTLRIPQAHTDALMLNASALGPSYGEYAGRRVDGSRLPQPLAERQADRARYFDVFAAGRRTGGEHSEQRLSQSAWMRRGRA